MRSGASPAPPGSETSKRTFVASTTSSRGRASHGASVSSERAVAVDVGGVDEGAARVEEAVEHPVGLLLARGRAAHEHRAEAQAGDGERAERCGLHVRRISGAPACETSRAPSATMRAWIRTPSWESSPAPRARRCRPPTAPPPNAGHPDRARSPVEAQARMAQLNAAWELLRDGPPPLRQPQPGRRAPRGAWLSEGVRRALGRELVYALEERRGRRLRSARRRLGQPAGGAGRHRPAPAVAARRRRQPPRALAALRRRRRHRAPRAAAAASRGRAARAHARGTPAGLLGAVPCDRAAAITRHVLAAEPRGAATSAARSPRPGGALRNPRAGALRRRARGRSGRCGQLARHASTSIAGAHLHGLGVERAVQAERGLVVDLHAGPPANRAGLSSTT